MGSGLRLKARIARFSLPERIDKRIDTPMRPKVSRRRLTGQRLPLSGMLAAELPNRIRTAVFAYSFVA